MTNFFIGISVGILMGLTGAGGALVSIPFFIHYFHFDLKSATVISLLVVFLGASLNLIMQKKKPIYKISFGHLIFGTLTSYFARPLKLQVSDDVISYLLMSVALYGLVTMWRKKKIKIEKNQMEEYFYLKVIISAIIVGLITTLTGLGGALILVPFLIRWFGLSHADAVITSLFSMSLVSMSTLLLQIDLIIDKIELMQVLLISIGIIISARGIVLLTRKIEPVKLDFIRRVLFSLVVVYACITILYK